jgi:Tfp pilus assembly protein PilN
MTNGPALNLNLATRPLRNRRLYQAAARALSVILIVLVGLSAFLILKDGRALSRLRKDMDETRRLQSQATRDERTLKSNITREEKLSGPRIDLVNGIIQRKMFSWTGLFTALEKCLPGASYITSLSPSFTPEGRLALQMRLISRSLRDLQAFITAINASGFKNIEVGAEQRDEDGRLLSEISTTYEPPL